MVGAAVFVLCVGAAGRVEGRTTTSSFVIALQIDGSFLGEYGIANTPLFHRNKHYMKVV